MGWASGSDLAETTWDLVREYIPDNKRQGIADKFADAFEQMDCDTIEECEVLMDDAKRPAICDECGKEAPYGTFSGGECNECAEKYR